MVVLFMVLCLGIGILIGFFLGRRDPTLVELETMLADRRERFQKIMDMDPTDERTR